MEELRDCHDTLLEAGDQVRYVGLGIRTMVSDPRPDVSYGNEGEVDGEYFSSLLIWVKFDKGGDRTPINRSDLEKIQASSTTQSEQ